MGGGAKEPYGEFMVGNAKLTILKVNDGKGGVGISFPKIYRESSLWSSLDNNRHVHTSCLSLSHKIYVCLGSFRLLAMHK